MTQDLSRARFLHLLGAGGLALTLAGCGGSRQDGRKIRIGFSQVTTTEPWRVLFNRQMRAEAAKHPDVQLIVADGQDRTEKQVADVQAFIQQRVDLILLSPKESAGLSQVVEGARSADIPVIVLDRDLATKAYAQFIGANNFAIGQLAGDYAVKLLGGAGAAKGKIVEIWGGMASTPAQERHQGFDKAIAAEPGIARLIDRQDADWKQDRAYNIMAAALKAHPVIDLVYAHNDPMAYGAWLAAKDVGRDGRIKFLGIDAIPDEGAKWVKDGALSATFAYPPPGAEGVRQGLKLLRGEKIQPRIELPTETVDAATVDAYLARNA